MSFAAGHYTFQYSISNSESGIYAEHRVKVTRHPDEEDIYFLARAFAFGHCFQPGLEFSRGLFEPSQPAIWHHNEIEELTIWCEVGCPEQEKLSKAIRRNADCAFRVYFYDQDQISRFCYYLRGSKVNWIEPVQFFLIEQESLRLYLDQIQSRMSFSLTFIDEIAYVSVNNLQTEFRIQSVDMWDYYQLSLAESVV